MLKKIVKNGNKHFFESVKKGSEIKVFNHFSGNNFLSANVLAVFLRIWNLLNLNSSFIDTHNDLLETNYFGVKLALFANFEATQAGKGAKNGNDFMNVSQNFILQLSQGPSMQVVKIVASYSTIIRPDKWSF